MRSYLLNYVVVEQAGVPRAHMDPSAVMTMYVFHHEVACSLDVPFASLEWSPFRALLLFTNLSLTMVA